jgi:membrane-bound serine protease (ClpP class)
MTIFWVIVLIVCGALLVVAELFLLPGFGIAGIGGVLSMTAAVVLAYMRLTAVYPWAGHIALVASVVITLIAIYIFWRSRAIEKMSLDSTIDSSVGLAEPGKKIENLEKEAEELEKNNQTKQ